MCEPTTIAAMALSAASGLAQMKSQGDAANAQSAANQRQHDANEKGRAFNISQIMEASVEDTDAAITAKTEASTEAAQARATARVAAGEAGLAIDSNSVEAMIGDFERQEGKNSAQINDNLKRLKQQRSREIEGVNIQADGKNSQLVTPTGPDFLGTALSVGGTMFGQYTNDLKIKSPKLQKTTLPSGNQHTENGFG